MRHMFSRAKEFLLASLLDELQSHPNILQNTSGEQLEYRKSASPNKRKWKALQNPLDADRIKDSFVVYLFVPSVYSKAQEKKFSYSCWQKSAFLTNCLKDPIWLDLFWTITFTFTDCKDGHIQSWRTGLQPGLQPGFVSSQAQTLSPREMGWETKVWPTCMMETPAWIQPSRAGFLTHSMLRWII